MRTRHSPSAGPVGARLLPYPGLLPAPALIGTPEAARHAMNSGVVTDIGKEASIARSGSTDDETKPKSGPQFAPHGKRSPIEATPCRNRVCPKVGPPTRGRVRCYRPAWDLARRPLPPHQPSRSANRLQRRSNGQQQS
jgi:hypothetical protein